MNLERDLKNKASVLDAATDQLFMHLEENFDVINDLKDKVVHAEELNDEDMVISSMAIIIATEIQKRKFNREALKNQIMEI